MADFIQRTVSVTGSPPMTHALDSDRIGDSGAALVRVTGVARAAAAGDAEIARNIVGGARRATAGTGFIDVTGVARTRTAGSAG